MLQSQSSGEIFQRIEKRNFNTILTYALNQEIVVVSLNGYIHCWNALRMKQVCNTPDHIAISLKMSNWPDYHQI